eukprot:CAMPEP_0179199434 /NCGR_PEP_ID=MMETSP0796-20121207/99221_1 /TAXON_ID=73915 /ORGANISM="Pyrodinium bahamense, Strain pbaha01" /LENGTH=32 /DNA_ID= /DNA_START= /DNA_END= /DNA_ORIENTATION=
MERLPDLPPREESPMPPLLERDRGLVGDEVDV